MKAIHVYVTSGASAGRRAVYTDPVVSFGRSGENSLVLDEPEVSRKHGELRFEEDDWWLYNLSPNGTKVGRRQVTKKPVALREGDSIGVSGKELFRVGMQDMTAAGGEVDAAAGDEAEAGATGKGIGRTKLSKKAKVWIGVGVYGAAMVVLFVTLAALSNGNGGKRSQETKELTAAEIRRAINDDPEPAERVNEEAALSALEEAHDHYINRETNLKHYFDAYQNYREALHYMGRTYFEQTDYQREYDIVREKVTEYVIALYQSAYSAKRTGDYEKAIRDFDRLLTFFSDSDHLVFRNADHHRREAMDARR